MLENIIEINSDTINIPIKRKFHLKIPGFAEIPRQSENLQYNEFFEQNLCENRPCILSSECTKSWNSTRDWRNADNTPNLNFFEELISKDEKVPISFCNKRYFNSQECKEEPIGSFFDYWRKKSAVDKDDCRYLKDWHFYRDWNSQYNAYTTPSYFCSDWLNEWWELRNGSEYRNDYRFVYIGPKNSWTPFHADVFGSFSWSANIVGKKRWIFFPPGEEVKLKDSLGNLVYDVESSESDEMEAKNGCAQRFEIIQGAGEIIFVPSGWHHQVLNLEDTISINHNWLNGCNIGYVFQLLQAELRKVELEIKDCKEDDNWPEMCQDLLRASYGMNYHDLISLLSCIVDRRVLMISNSSSVVLFDGCQLGVNHAKFDILRAKDVLEHLKEELMHLDMINLLSTCESLIHKCKEYK